MQQQIIKETFHLVSNRDDNVCNFLEGGTLIGGSDFKLIYRHYATLYFVFCVDSSESELGILDLIQVRHSLKLRLLICDWSPSDLVRAKFESILIALIPPKLTQVFVETLDKCFENVCELDLIFHVDKVSAIQREISLLTRVRKLTSIVESTKSIVLNSSCRSLCSFETLNCNLIPTGKFQIETLFITLTFKSSLSNFLHLPLRSTSSWTSWWWAEWFWRPTWTKF